MWLAFIAGYLVLKIAHDWIFELPLRLEGYVSLILRLLASSFFVAAMSDKLKAFLGALCAFSVLIVSHAIIGQLLVLVIEPANAPILDAAEANSFSYTQIGWLFFYSQIIYVTDSFLLYRGHGVMWEPGIFQFFCNYLIVFGFSSYSRSNKKWLIALGAIGVLVSTSTMGLLIAGIIILINTRFSFRSVLLVALMAVIPSIFIFASKFEIGASESVGTVIRLIDLEVPISYAIRFPIFGVGNDPTVVLQLGVHSYLLDYLLGEGQSQLLSDYIENVFDTERIFNTSNGLLALLMQYGSVFTGAYALGFYRFAKLSGLGTSMFILVLLTTFNEPVELTVLFLWFSMHGLMMPRPFASESQRNWRWSAVSSSGEAT
jgi:hypothetical protein